MNNNRESRIDAAIADYLQAAEAGAPPPREAWLAKYADLRAELEQFLADRSAFRAAAEPVQELTLPLNERTAAPTCPVVRYFGDYELVEEIARGGMGVVWRARQVSLNRPVAVKMILAGELASSADVRRFHAEAEAAANLDHPNILPIYEVGEHEGQHYFSMKLVAGGSLADAIRAKNLDPRTAVALLAKVARAVHFAHQRGILHRDLKPGNVLIDKEVTPYVTDFGLARRVEGESGLTHTGAIVGTPSYMAPEQARAAKQLSTAVDVYSLGAILYELLTGVPPFRAATQLDTVLHVLERDPDHPLRVNSAADRDLAVVAMNCLEKDPARRYGSAEALADELGRWLSGEPIVARPVSRAERSWRWCRRNPVVASLAAAVLLAVFVGTITSLVFGIQSQRRATIAKDNEERASRNEAIAKEKEELANGAVVRATLEQTQALRMARRPGWRDECLFLLQTTVTIAQQIPAYRHVGSYSALRTEAVMALTQPDLTPVREFHAASFGPALHYSRDGNRAAQVYLVPGRASLGPSSNGDGGGGLRVVELMTGKEIASVAMDPKNPDYWDMDRLLAIDSKGDLGAFGTARGDLDLRELMTGKKTVTLRRPPERPHAFVYGAWFTPDEKQVIALLQPENDKVELDKDGKTEPELQLVLWDVARPTMPRVILREPLSGKGAPALWLPTYFIKMLHICGDSKRLCIPWPSDFSQGPRATSLRLVDFSTDPINSEDIPIRDSIRSAEWHPSQPKLAIVTGTGRQTGHIELWDIDQKKPHRSFEGEVTGWCASAFSHDGTQLAVASDEGIIRVFDTTTGGELVRLVDSELSTGSSVFWNKRGQLLAATPAGHVKLWEWPKTRSPGELHFNLRISGEPAFSPDGRFLAAFATTSVRDPALDLFMGQRQPAKDDLRLIDRQTGRVVRTFPGTQNPTVEIGFSPDGRWLYQTMVDLDPREERVDHFVAWDVETGREVSRRRLPAEGPAGPWAKAFLGPQRRVLALTLNRSLKKLAIWDFENEKFIATFNEIDDDEDRGDFTPYLLISHHGTRLVHNRNGMIPRPREALRPFRVYDLASGKLLNEISIKPSGPLTIHAVEALSGDGGRALTFELPLGPQGRVTTANPRWRVLDLLSGAELTQVPPGNRARRTGALSFDGQLVALIAEADVEVWHVNAKTPLFVWQPFNGKTVQSVVFTQQGDLAAVPADGDRLPLLRMTDLRRQLVKLGLGW